MKTPYLVQRGEIKRPLAASDVRFSNAVDLDYMGSAEFEFGALPRSLRAMQAISHKLKKSVMPSISENGAPLKVLHGFSDEEFKEYEKFLLRMRGGDLRLKESTRFAADGPVYKYSVTDVWWDIENNVIWSFDANFMGHLLDYLSASWTYMDAQKRSA